MILSLIIFLLIDLGGDVANDERIEQAADDDGDDAEYALEGVTRGDVAVTHCEHLALVVGDVCELVEK